MPTKASVAAAAAAASPESELDYEAPDTLIVDQPAQLKALSDELRSRVIALLRERAFSTQQLSLELGVPKGTIGHHLKVLEQAGLIRVVRTRKVRAVTEKFYGRTARLFLFQTEDPADARALGATTLRQAASEIERAPAGANFGHPKARLTPEDFDRFEQQLKTLMDDFLAADTPGGDPIALVGALYRRAGA
ncbi:MAG TPA: winged helix-turn-helix domain-containing protein [Gaiellaceae bacterium]|nr:winged helix-turn-helix domain-containing protein [Gaiellaceae bacterium]